MRAFLLASATLLASSCGDGVRDDPWCADEAVPPAADAAERTYWRDARPIFDRHCVGCHTEGGSALFAIDDPATAATWSALIGDAVRTRRMPPFLAAPCCRDYDRSSLLSDEEIATVLAWAEQGAPEGDPADAVSPDPPTSPLDRVDVELRPTEGFVPPSRVDHNHCFLYDWPIAEDRFIVGVAPRVDRRESVHHLIVAAIGPAGVAEAERRDAEDPAPGFACPGGIGGLEAVQTLGGSLLGGTFPRGIGAPISGGSRILVQIHYWADAEDPAADRTGVDFQVAEDATTSGVIVLTNPAWAVGRGMRVPAGDPDRGYGYTMSADLFTSNRPVMLQGITPHLHRYARAVRASVVRRRDDPECLVEIPRWDFGWEQPYWFAEPVRLEPDDALYLECRFDNSARNQPEGGDPRTIAWGEDDQDMCAAFLTFTAIP